MARQVPLTRGYVAIVDDEDYERVAAFNWCARPDKNTVYGYRKRWDGERWVGVHLHRFVVSAPPNLLIDHVDGDGLNNRRANLRLATHQQNSANLRPAKMGAVGLRGVTLAASGGITRYRAQIALHGKKYALGVFESAEAAALAYDLASALANGDFAVLNNPDRAALVLKAAGLAERGHGRRPRQTAEILRLADNGAAPREIAAALGITRPSVKGALYRARRAKAA